MNALTLTSDLSGETLRVSVADGSATYEVNDTGEPDFVTLVHVGDEGDNYRDALLGISCMISRTNVLEKLNMQKRWDDQFELMMRKDRVV